MAHINLLPWREELRQERQQQFIVAVVAGLIFAVIALYGAILYADSLLDEQASRNNFLQAEIAKLDVKIKEIKTLEEERARLVARMQVIQHLQSSRPKVVKVFDSMVRTVPEGTHLSKVARKNSILTFNGVAQSNARVSVFMRNLDENTEFAESTLKVIQKKSTSDKAVRNFAVEISESKPVNEDGEI